MTSWTIDFNSKEPITTSDAKFSLPSLAHRIQKIEGVIGAIQGLSKMSTLVDGVEKAHEKVFELLDKVEKTCEETEHRVIAIRDNTLCIICLANPRNRALLHGDTAHVCVCATCCERLSSCPVCMNQIERVITLFHS